MFIIEGDDHILYLYILKFYFYSEVCIIDVCNPLSPPIEFVYKIT